MAIASHDETLKQEIIRRELGHCTMDGAGGSGREMEPSIPRILRETASHRGSIVGLKGEKSLSSVRWGFPTQGFSRSKW